MLVGKLVVSPGMRFAIFVSKHPVAREALELELCVHFAPELGPGHLRYLARNWMDLIAAVISTCSDRESGQIESSAQRV
jgi:hypothetical protein